MLALNTVTGSAAPSVFHEKVSATKMTGPISVSASTPTVDPTRVKTTVERPLELVTKAGKSIGTVDLPAFLGNLYKLLKGAKIEPRHFDVSGGGVAYLIGREQAQRYAEQEGIQHPNLDEFDRLKDLDFSIDLSGHTNYCLWVMRYFVIKALRQSGIKLSQSELYKSVFIRHKVVNSPKEALCILSVGDPNGFWVDFTFIMKGRRELFVRDNPRCDITPYLTNNQYDLIWRSPSSDPMQPIRNRLEKKLDINDPETINHLGFPLAHYYQARGYEIVDPCNIPILAKQFVEYHLYTGKNYGDTFDQIRQNHIGKNEQALYVKMVVACLRELVVWKNIQLSKWLETFELQGDSPESRLFNFIKNKGMERYHLSASDVFCLADLIGVEPRLAYPAKAWAIFFRKRIQFSMEDREHLFSSTDSMPVLVAKKLLKNQEFNCPIQPQDLFPLLKPQKGDKSAFIELKFEWEAKHSIKDALQTFQSYQSSLPDETKRAFLTKLLSLKGYDLQPYLPCIFAEKIDDQQWIVKLIQDKLPAKALQLCLLRNTHNIYEFTLEQLLKANLTKEFAGGLNQIQQRHPATYLKLMSNNNWKEAFSKHVSDEQEFIKKLRDCLEKKQYRMAQNLMRVNANKFSLPTDMIEKIVTECYRQAFKENDFDNLEFLLRHAKDKVIIDLTNKLAEKQTDTAKKEWAAKFFALPVAEFKAKQASVAVACVDQIKIDEAEAWLKITLEDFLTTRNLRLLKVVNHCTTILRANQRKISSELLPLFNQVATHLLQTRDSPNLIQFLSAILTIKVKLDLPKETILQIQEMDDPTDELSRLFSKTCHLPEDVERTVVEAQLKKLANSKPKQAIAKFKDKSYLWAYSPVSLSKFFNDLPFTAPLKYEVFNQLLLWDKTTWEQMVQCNHLSEEQLFHLLMDPRARDFVNMQWISHYLQVKKGSLEKAAQLVETLQLTLNTEFLSTCLKCLNQSNGFSSDYIAFLRLIPCIDAASVASKEVMEEFKTYLNHLQQKTPYSLIETIPLVKNLIGKLPEEEQKDFAVFYLNLLPIDFEEVIYSEEERGNLHDIIDAYAIEAPFTTYLGITDSSSEKIERAFKQIVKHKFFKSDKVAQKKIVAAFSQLITDKPTLWKPLGQQFYDEYLTNKNLCLTSQDLLELLKDAAYPDLQGLFLRQALKSKSTDYAKQALNQLSDLVKHCQINLCKEIISHPQFKMWTQHGYLAVEFKKEVDKLAIKITLDAASDIDETKIRKLKWIGQYIHLGNYKDLNFEQVWKSMADCLGHGLITTTDPKPYFIAIEEFVNLYSQLIGADKEDVQLKPLPFKNIPLKLQKQIPGYVSKFLLEIMQVLQAELKAPTPAKPDVLQHCFALLEIIIPQIGQKASFEFCKTMYLLVDNFFKSPDLCKNAQLADRIFYYCKIAIKKGIYREHYQMLVETANCFSWLNMHHPARTAALKTVYLGLSHNHIDPLKFWVCDPQVKEITNSEPLIDKLIHLVKGMVYSVPLDNFDLNNQWRELLVGVINGINTAPLNSVIPSKLCNSWSLYIKYQPGTKLDETTFCEAFELILKHLPKEFIPKSFNHLIHVYIDCCDFYSLPLDMPMLNCINKLLALHPIENTSSADLEVFDMLVLKMLDKSKSIQSEPIKSAVMGSLLKWVVPANIGDFSLRKANTIYTTIRKVTLSSKNKGFNVTIFGSLDRLTDFITTKCKDLETNQDAQNLLISIFQWLAQLAYTPPEFAKNPFQLVNRELCTPMVKNTFAKILEAIGHIHGDHLKQLLEQILERAVEIQSKAVEIQSKIEKVLNDDS